MVQWEPVEKIEWKFDRAGWFCTEPGVTYDHCEHRDANKVFTQEEAIGLIAGVGNQTALLEDWAIWWEPSLGNNGPMAMADWTLPKNKTIDIQAQYKATLETMEPSVQKFVVRKRMIGPKKTGNQMTGSDVQMLEKLLWQLGLSPQKANPGKEGARIKSIRYGTTRTEPCIAGQTEERNHYLTGWDSCASGKVSMEGNVKRFQARSFSANKEAQGGNKISNDPAKKYIDGFVGDGTLGKLYQIWRHYQLAYRDFTAKEVYLLSDIDESWWTALETLAEDGGAYPFAEGEKYQVEKTYTSTEHSAVVEGFPDNAKGIKRSDIFKAWVLQESGGYFWGAAQGNKLQHTPFRVHEGGGDEHGSMGFNHALWRKMYGVVHECDSFRGYNSHGGYNVNLYHPKNSLLAFWASAAENCSSASGMYLAYAATENTYKTEIKDNKYKPKRYCYEDKSDSDRCKADSDKWEEFTDTKDQKLNLLGKAIMAYNTGDGKLHKRNYFSDVQMLRSQPIGKKNSKGKWQMGSTKLAYWLSIKLKTQNRPGMSGYLPLVSYIWEGGKGFDVNGDGSIADVIDDPATPEDEAVTETTVPWCFVYGEGAWMRGVTFDDALNQTRRIILGIPDEGDVNYEVDCQ
ncbi:MAG: hypothetical protein P8X74_23620 [Reinekea sp.]